MGEQGRDGSCQKSISSPVSNTICTHRGSCPGKKDAGTETDAIVKDAERDLLFYNSYEINAAEREELRKSVKSMFRTTNLRELYKDFYAWAGRPDLFRYAKAGRNK